MIAILGALFVLCVLGYGIDRDDRDDFGGEP